MNFSRASWASGSGVGCPRPAAGCRNDLREVLSSKYDADLAEVISNLTARQIALQASMKATAQTFQMTLLDYL